MEYYSAFKRRMKYCICSNTDGLGDVHTKSVSQTEKQISY